MKENNYVIWGVNIGKVKKDKDGDLYVHTTNGQELSINLGWEKTNNCELIKEIDYKLNI